MKIIITFKIILITILCNSQVNDSKELIKKANIYFKESELEKEKKIDSCLKIINEAIKIDNENFNAYLNKFKFLSLKKDIKGLIKNNQKMVELKPDKPYWKIQRGLFFEIDNNKIEAEKNYKIGIAEYENLMKSEKLKKDFNFRMEYLTALETSSNLRMYKKEFRNIANDFPNNEMFKIYKKEYKTKEQIIDIWKNVTD